MTITITIIIMVVEKGKQTIQDYQNVTSDNLGTIEKYTNSSRIRFYKQWYFGGTSFLATNR